MNDYENLMHAARNAALKAAEAIMPFWQNTVQVQHKLDDSPVSAADYAAHDAIVQVLMQHDACIPVVSEEGELPEPDAMPARYWLVDPLDGTKSFLRGSEHFTVNIALMEAHRPVLGVIAVPALGLLYSGAQGHAYKREAQGADAPICCAAKMQTPLRVLVSRSHLDAKTKAYLHDHEAEIGECVAVASALKFAVLAEGEADLYPRFGPTMEWDSAAGHAIVEAAGGAVTTPQGTPFLYGKSDWRNGPFIVQSWR